MVNINEFKAQCARCGLPLEDVVARLGTMSYASFWRKLNGKSEFDRGDISRLKEILSLSDEQLLAIFFSE